MRRPQVIFCLLYLVFSTLVVFVAGKVSPELGASTLIPVLCIVPAIVVIRKFPAALIPVLFYMGSLKPDPADSAIDLSDPTFWTLCLVSGSMLVHGLFGIAGIYRPSLFDRIKSESERIFAYLLFAGVIAVSYLYTLAPEFGFSELSHFIVVGSILYFAPLVLVRSEVDIRHFITSAVLLSVAVAVRRLFGIAASSEALRSGAVEDLTKIGAAELIGLGLLLVLLPPVRMRAYIPRNLMLALIPLLAIGMTVSIARGPILSFIFIVIVGSLSRGAKYGLFPRRLLIPALLLLAVPTLLVSSLWLADKAERKVEGKKSELVKLLTFSDPGGSAGHRLSFYRQAVEGFGEKPLLGWGIGSFSVYATGRDIREYPHNIILQIAMEQGILGLASLGFFFITMFRVLQRINASSRGEWSFISLIILYLLMIGMFSGNLDDQRALFTFCGLASASWRVLEMRYAPILHGHQYAFQAAAPQLAGSPLWRA